MIKEGDDIRVGSGRILIIISCLLTMTATAMAQDKLLFDDPHLMIPAHYAPTMALAVGDVDNDGDFDFFAGNYDVEDRLYLNNGVGVFSDAGSQFTTGRSPTEAMALGDLDGDGDLDLFIAKKGQNHLFINDGAGVFVDATSQLPVDNKESKCVALGDVDNDGDLDVFVGNGHHPSRPAYNSLYLNDGTGVFSDASSQIPSHCYRTYAVAMGDVDDDGDLDVFVGNQCDPDQLYLNDGAGWFMDATNQIPAHDNSTSAAVFGDVDGDGDLDVLLGNYWMRDQLYLNDGSGTFIDATTQFPNGDAKTEDVALGDVDGDGDLDALIGTEYQAFLFLNDGTGVFSNATDRLPDGEMRYYAVMLADIDGDADLDALIGSRTQNRLLLNNGSGMFFDYTSSISPDCYSAISVALGDLDGDGDLDAVVGNSEYYYLDGNPNRVYINNGQGRLIADPDRIPDIDEDTTVVILGDVDSDGDLDLFVGNDDWPNSCSLYINNGKGRFFDASKLIPEGDHTLCAAFGDVDGDGDLDIFCGTAYRDDYLYLNNGNGGFFDASRRLPSHRDRTMGAAFGDVDGDEDLDLFISDDAYGMNRLYLNDGNGLFSDATNQIPPAGYDYILSIALGDVDNDGDLDVFLASDEDRLYINDGAGWFSDATSQIPVDNLESYSVALGDVDNDGDLDAFMGNEDWLYSGTREINLYLNNGQGHFVDASDLVSWTIGPTFFVALGDLDEDGDLDAFTGKRYQNRLFLNLTNQLACRGVPRIGKSFSLEVHGPPNGWYILAASTHSDNVPMPPLGDLRILLDGVIYRSSDSFDSEGRAVLDFEVPPFPTIVGKRLYWQAFVWNPGHFTNLEVTTLTDL